MQVLPIKKDNSKRHVLRNTFGNHQFVAFLKYMQREGHIRKHNDAQWEQWNFLGFGHFFPSSPTFESRHNQVCDVFWSDPLAIFQSVATYWNRHTYHKFKGE
jgi:hypothetical protein